MGVPTGTQARYRVVSDLRHLRGYVQVPTPAMALAFVRLRTAIATYLFFGRRTEIWALEIIPQDRISGGIVFREDRVVSAYRQGRPSHARGILSPQEARRVGYTPPVIRALAGGCVVTRLVLEVRLGKPISPGQPTKLISRVYLPVRLTEWVGADGEYRVHHREPLRDAHWRAQNWNR